MSEQSFDPNQAGTTEALAKRQHEFLEPGSGKGVEFKPVPLESEDAIYENIDLQANPIVAELDAGDNRFVIFEDRSEGKSSGHYFLSPTINKGHNRETGRLHFVPTQGIHLQPGTSFSLGTTHLKELNAALHVNNTLSRRHATIEVDAQGKIKIAQEGNTNGTHVFFGEQSAEQPIDDLDAPTRPRAEVEAERVAGRPTKLVGTLKDANDQKAETAQWWQTPEVVAKISVDKPQYEQAEPTNGDWMDQPHIADEVAKNSEGEVVPEQVVEEVGEVAVDESVEAAAVAEDIEIPPAPIEAGDDAVKDAKPSRGELRSTDEELAETEHIKLSEQDFQVFVGMGQEVARMRHNGATDSQISRALEQAVLHANNYADKKDDRDVGEVLKAAFMAMGGAGATVRDQGGAFSYLFGSKVDSLGQQEKRFLDGVVQDLTRVKHRIENGDGGPQANKSIDEIVHGSSDHVLHASERQYPNLEALKLVTLSMGLGAVRERGLHDWLLTQMHRDFVE